VTGRPDSWAVVPTYADRWIDTGDRITAVRGGSPAERAGITAGDTLGAVAGVPTDDAVAAFWSPLGLARDGERAAYAARVLARGGATGRER
jgi:S1-C subfamily serine protease